MDLPGTAKFLQDVVKGRVGNDVNGVARERKNKEPHGPGGVCGTQLKGESLQGTLQSGQLRESTEKEVLRVSW